MNEEKKVKLEYVNPLNPNEIIKTNYVSNEIVKDEGIIKITEPPKVTNKKKKSNKLIYILIIILIIIIGITSIFIFNKKDNKDTEKPVTEEKVNITLNDISSNLKNSDYYSLLEKDYITNATINNNELNIELTKEETIKKYTFTLENRDLVIYLNETDVNNFNILYTVIDSISIYYKHDKGDVINYIKTLQDGYNFNLEAIKTEKTDLGYKISINIDTNINTDELNNISFTLNDLKVNETNILNNTDLLTKGNLVLYTTSNESYNFIIGQKKEITDASYNTIISIIELLYPNEKDSFKEKFKSISNISFDRYKITIDPIINITELNDYSDYKFISLEIQKTKLQ